jgi:hypothetical protein
MDVNAVYEALKRLAINNPKGKPEELRTLLAAEVGIPEEALIFAPYNLYRNAVTRRARDARKGEVVYRDVVVGDATERIFQLRRNYPAKEYRIVAKERDVKIDGHTIHTTAVIVRRKPTK